MIYLSLTSSERRGKMKTVGIICEYNPFHNGHKRQIDILHGMGYDCIVCVMSGNYTQRGELAMFDKYTRAKSAVLGGADIVFELPFPYSSLSAEGFAAAGVHILASLGVSAISFGSECGDVRLLEQAADAVISSSFAEIYSGLLKGGRGSAAAYFEAINTISGNDLALLSNDILGISYISAIKRSGYDMKIIPIKREGAAYNEKMLSSGTLPSASAIREAVKTGGESLDYLLCEHIPEMALSPLSDAKSRGVAPVFIDSIGGDAVSFFRLMSPDELAVRAANRSCGGVSIAEDGVGICERICNAARVCETFDELRSKAYTSKYTDARINRVMLFSLLGVSDKPAKSLPEYTTLLASNNTGRVFLSNIRKSDGITVVTKPSDAPGDSIQRKLSEAADRFYTYAMPAKHDQNVFIKSRPFILKNKI